MTVGVFDFGYNFPYGPSFYKDRGFYGSPIYGVAVLEVQFYAAVDGYDYVWDFGDGKSSTEKDPIHRYEKIGAYSVSVIYSKNGSEVITLTRANYIIVSSAPVSLISSYPDFCFKLALKPSQGQGITPITGRWVWPTLIASVAKGHDENNESISLAINAEDMSIYQIGIPECWTDREGSYDESEIECEAMLPEINSTQGPHENVRHVETHLSCRSWDEKNYRDKEGYTEDGLREGHELSLQIFKSGEQITPESTLQKLNLEGDYAFLKEIEARRFQIKIKHSTSAFRDTRIAIHAQQIDNKTLPQNNYIAQKAYQKELSLPDLWLSKNKPTIYTNRADGAVLTGTATTATGPDGNLTAINSGGLSGTLSYAFGDFTIICWAENETEIFTSQVNGFLGQFKISITNYILTVTDGIDTISSTLSSVSWACIAVVRRGNSLELYENGLLKIVYTLSGIRSYGGSIEVANGSIYDLRRITRAASADALYYYYTNYFEFVP